MEHTPIKHYYKHINHTSTNFKLNLIKPSYTGSDRYQTFMAYNISKKKILSKKMDKRSIASNSFYLCHGISTNWYQLGKKIYKDIIRAYHIQLACDLLYIEYTDTKKRNFSFTICLKNDLRSNLKTISSFPFMNHTLNCFNEIVLHVCCTLLLFICILTRKYLIFHRIVIILISTISESWRDVPSFIKIENAHIFYTELLRRIVGWYLGALLYVTNDLFI